MLLLKSNAVRVVEATLAKVTKVSRPVAKFILHIVELWLAMNCRYVFTNMQRWGTRTEKSYRGMFSKHFDWFGFNYALVQEHCSKELIAAFDLTYISKSGKHTYGVGKFWSGTSGKALKGLEVGCLALVDVANATAMPAIVEQTPPVSSLKRLGKTLIDHYVRIIEKHIDKIRALTSYLVVDGYFMKQAFIKPLLKRGLRIITKARKDANFKYLYKGKAKGGKGRPKLYEGKVNIKAIDKRRIKCCYKDKDKKVFATVLYSVQLKVQVLAAFVYYKGKQVPQIIISTDTAMKPIKMCTFYGLRFQIEFLIRDAKQYTGLEHCQARSQPKLHNYFNLAINVVAVAKAAYYLSVPKQKRGSFSMADVKMKHMNELITNRIFHNLAIDLSDEKIIPLYHQCLNFGRLRA